jgi:hypothetical protein
MKLKFSIIFFFIMTLIKFSPLLGQGYNHTWLLGHTANKMRMNFTDTSYSLIPEVRKMTFYSTQGNISDQSGNFLMSSNGLWIANSTGDTMLNGAGLNPGSFANSWPVGLPIHNANVILPWPGDSTKYALFHHTATFDGISYPAYEVFLSIIDMNLDNGLGGVISKNDAVLQDTLGWGLTACKHANGRDWWVVALKNESDEIFKLLLTPDGIESVTSQPLNVPDVYYSNGQPVFSPDGTKFAYPNNNYNPLGYYDHDIRIFNFDRCSGLFSNEIIVDNSDSLVGAGLAFSSNSKYIFATSVLNVYQINTDTTDIQASLQVVAQNDTFYSPNPPFMTDFLYMYLAANGKIYITSGNAVVDLHYINYPDSEGMSCDVEQHAINLPGFNFRTVPNHPNYYLGRLIGSACDTLTSVNDLPEHNFRFRVFPNPVTDGNFKIIYLLPQNKSGRLEVYDMNGRRFYEINLPQWSTLQHISLPKGISGGVYNCMITSDNGRVSKKLIILK